ncbi:hypothetical protein FRC12_016182 [Ceratobasidium sp. 428]|nr:hypothetical protein FRC12_016182 [Ceratobasidium sp. 428]
MSPENQTLNTSFLEAFSRWKEVYEQLTSILDSFTLECTQLSMALRHPDAFKWSGLQGSLRCVETASTSIFNAYTSQTSSICNIFTTVLHRSRSFAPFDRLPDELVVYILSFVNAGDPLDLRYEPYPADCQQAVSPLLNIMATNKRLRHLATETPSLWTYVDVFVEDLDFRPAYVQYLRGVLLKSQQLPLQVRITGRMFGEEEDEADEDIIKMILTRLLGPHAHRITSFDLQIPLTFAWPVILDLFSNVQPAACQIREFYINDPEAYPEQFDNEFPDRFFAGDLNAFFQSLQVIGMRGFFIPFTAPAYRDLTVLKIMPYVFELSQPSTLVELRNALAACPKLRSLALIECHFVEIDSQMPIEPVFLPDLEVLDLRSARNVDEFLALMSCIDSGPNELALSVSADGDMYGDPMAELRRFIRQFNVTRLCLDATIDTTDMDWLLTLPQGETLAIRELALCAYDFEEAELNQPLRASRFPSLRALHLMECENINIPVCRQLLDASTIQILRFDRPRVLAQEIFTIAPSVEHCRFSASVACGEDDCEWPVSVSS